MTTPLFPDLPETKGRADLQTHGTKAFDLKSSSLLSGAQKDMRTKALNASGSGQRTRWYTFHRDHVRKADTPEALLRLALSDREQGLKSGKPNTRLVYEDKRLLRAAVRRTYPRRKAT